MIIENGEGTGNKLGINGRNEAKTFAVTETEAQAASEVGDAYNINTGDIISIASGNASLIYFKNDEEADIIIEAMAIGLRGFTNLTDMAVITVIRNPTTGDIVSDATAVAMNQNRNFGSSKTLKSTTLAYKGKNAGTFTDGDNIVQFYQGNNSRLFAGINLEVPRGSAVGIKVEGGGATAGTAYAALVMHLKDSKR